MGKKNKKKAARNAQKEKRFPTAFSKTDIQDTIPTTDTVVEGIPVIKEKQTCSHFDKGIDLEKFSLKISSLESLKCDDCREGVADRKTKKGKVKNGKNSKFESTSIWVCLDCGHFSCGGVGFPTTPQSHASRHSKQYHHPLAIQFANPNLRWCFSCNTLIPVQYSNENGEQKQDVLSEFIKILKTRSSLETRVDVEDIWFGNGSITSRGNLVNTLQNSGYTVKGLVNLGNTCFFNSVLQNLLAMDKLRDYFFKLDGSVVGPLTVSLKKLFIETSSSTGDVINPRSVFGGVCAKASQFKGFQQHDSHELLRCFLDGLSTEESRSRKRAQNGNDSPKHTYTFVDTVFGGQISSTVSCLECGHASVVYEPFLDLSLPLPTKKSPSKKIPSVSRSKKAKPKLPPKKHGKFRNKSKNVTNISNNDSTQTESVVLDEVSDKIDSALQNGIKQIKGSTVILPDTASSSNSNVSSLTSNGHDTARVEVDFVDSEESSWLDYLAPSTSTVQDSSLIRDSGNSNDVEQEPSDFDGFGGLFDEPEPDVGPTVNNPLLNGIEGSESDPDEVDDTESPVSVEKCLAYFTTPELLTKTEHAWQCEQCSKSLLEKKTKFNIKPQINVSNGGNNGISSVSSVSGTDHLLSNGFGNHNDRKSADENSTALYNGKSDSCHGTESCSGNGHTDKFKNGDVEKRESSDDDEDDEVDSKGAKVARDATKRILISRAPPILTVHLKRFCQDARGRLSKLNGHVSFRDTIDLKPYMDPSCCKDSETYKYRLVGVVEHLGTMRGGHYVAYVKGGAKGNLGITENDDYSWYHASDAYVRKASLEEVLRCEAYILFYEEM